MYCKKCGNELQDGMTFCNKCGTKVGENINQSSNLEKKRKKYITNIICVVVVIIVIGGINFAVQKANQSSAEHGAYVGSQYTQSNKR